MLTQLSNLKVIQNHLKILMINIILQSIQKSFIIIKYAINKKLKKKVKYVTYLSQLSPRLRQKKQKLDHYKLKKIKEDITSKEC